MTKTHEPLGADGTPLPLPDHAFQQGQFARLNGISKDDAPYGEDDAKLKDWLKGWKDADKEPKSWTTEDKPATDEQVKEADKAKEDTKPETKATGQADTVSDAKN